MQPLLLASSSPYRSQLLKQLQLPFDSCSPDIDETPLLEEKAEGLVVRLAEQKARAVVDKFPTQLIITSDQVAVIDH
jgi:predicted house-cleaning NTP pyrophosphatase (Maf/HAM1 superfamily)